MEEGGFFCRGLSSVLLTHYLELADDVPDERPAVQRYVGIVCEVVQDDARAGCTDVHCFLGVEESGLCIRSAFPDVSGNGCVLGEHVKDIRDLFDLVCHRYSSCSETLELFLEILHELLENFLEAHGPVLPDSSEIALDFHDKIIVLLYKFYVTKNLFHFKYPQKV